jgi:hypothetical protein
MPRVFGSYVVNPHYDHLKKGLKTAEGRAVASMKPGMATLKAGEVLSFRLGLYGRKRHGFGVGDLACTSLLESA